MLRDAAADAWQCFTHPCEIVETCRHDEVLNCLRRGTRVESEGLHAAGFISYEAAPAFDCALVVREAPGFPLLWFGLFPAVETISLPAKYDSGRSVRHADDGYMLPEPRKTDEPDWKA